MAPLFFPPFLLLLASQSVQAQQNISLGSWLTPQGSNRSWNSQSGDFAFGFRPVEGNSSFFLLAVWFNKISDQTVAWYAKASDSDQAPIQVSSSAHLELNSSGALSLKDSTGSEVWNPKVVGAAYAIMLNTGNFILAAADGSTKWGTFNNPADTILPTQVLTSGMSLRSRIIPTDYSNGRFLLNVADVGVQFQSVAVPSNYQYDPYWHMLGYKTTKLVFNDTGVIYMTFDDGTESKNITTGPGITGPMEDYYHRATLDTDGVFRQYVYPINSGEWSLAAAWTVVGFTPPNICEAMTTVGSGVCGFNSYCNFDSSSSNVSCLCPPMYSFLDEQRKYKGCKPDFQAQSCDLDEASAMAQFELKWQNNVDWPLSDYEKYTPVTEIQCRRLCLIDCFCTAAVFHDSDNTCWKKKTPLSNGKMMKSVQRTLLLKLPKNNNSQTDLIVSGKLKKDKTYWILGSSILVGSSVLVNLLLILVLFFGTYRTITIIKIAPTSQSSSNLGLPLKAFNYTELEKATGGFKEVLGTGASGIVYKGQLQDNLRTFIAVKKIDKLQKETEKEFTMEVQAIGQTNHRNLVRLLGFCSEGSERLLVYEFMANGSLSRLLFGDVRLQWNLRVQLALGVARGLSYLHEECSTQIIHCDIKPQNILLDDKFTAKISDFGLAKLLQTNQTQTITGIRGTRGYVAPEWFKSTGITAKVDVYSFGVILLELICCRRNVELEAADEDRRILTYWANDCYRCGRVDLLVEGDDGAISSLKKVESFVAVALWCLQEDPSIRPTMVKVTQMLDGAGAVPTPPDSSSFVRPFP